MNQKYYLRGLGVGIVITAIVMGIAVSNKKPSLTDEEIMIKAKALGMIENEELAEAVEDTKKETEVKLREEIEQELRTEIEAEYEKMAQAVAGINQERGSKEQTETITFRVGRGENPQSIDERLKDEGLISEEERFDDYLLENGYDRKIVAKEYTIPKDADMELIAKIITGQRVTSEE